MSAKPSNATSPTFEAITPRSWWRGLLSTRFADIWLVTGAGALVALVLLGLAFSSGKKGEEWSEARKIFFGAFLAVAGGTAARFYDLANRRAGTIDMITSDIISIGRLLIALQVLDDFMAEARTCKAKISAGAVSGDRASDSNTDARPGHGMPNPKGQGFADSARRSDYFAVFHALIPDLRALDSGPVNDVTAFYTFFKGGRDATESAERWKNADYPPQWKIHDIVAIIYSMNLSLIHGRRAIRILVQDAAARQAADKIFKDLIVKGLVFLNEFLTDKGDSRQEYNLERIRTLCAEDEELKRILKLPRPPSAIDAAGGPVTTPGTS